MKRMRQNVRIVSYNIHKGFNLGNNRFLLPEIREALHHVDADIVFLQEVVGSHTEKEKLIEVWPKQPQFEFLAESNWRHFTYGKNAITAHGHHGNAILSKFPIAIDGNIDISTNQFEQRGLLFGVIKIPRRALAINLICLHLSLFKSGRRSQVDFLCKVVERKFSPHDPLIIAGDFNDWRCEFSQLLASRLGVKEAFVETTGTHAKTFPSPYPLLCLDRIYCRGFEVMDAQVLAHPVWPNLSDHIAVYSELQLPPASARSQKPSRRSA